MELEQKTLLIWSLLVCAARERRTYRYSDITAIMGGGNPRNMGKYLEPIYRLCKQRGWPPLTVLVVNKATGVPSDGLPLDAAVPVERERVFNFNWFELEPPETPDFRAVLGKASVPADPSAPGNNGGDAAPDYKAHKGRLFGEQEGVCAGCGQPYFFRILEVDHILPRARGGTDDVSNLQLLCSACNRSKGSKTMEEWQDKIAASRRPAIA